MNELLSMWTRTKADKSDLARRRPRAGRARRGIALWRASGSWTHGKMSSVTQAAATQSAHLGRKTSRLGRFLVRPVSSSRFAGPVLSPSKKWSRVATEACRRAARSTMTVVEKIRQVRPRDCRACYLAIG